MNENLSFLPDWFIEKIGSVIQITKSPTGASFFSFAENTIYLSERWVNFERTMRMLHSSLAHEMGHAYHYNIFLITDEKIAPVVRDFYKQGKKLLSQMTDNQLDIIQSNSIPQNIGKLQKLYESAYSFAEVYRYLAVVGDIFASLTGGEIGFGHPKNYWQDSIRKFQEFFANSADIYLNGNPILTDYFPEFVLLINTFWNNEKERTAKI